MWFWIYMLLMTLLVPVIALVFGSLFSKKAPSDINWVFGYRTKRSMKNKNTWAFAHRYMGRIWRVLGIIMIPITVVIMLMTLRGSADTVGIAGGILICAQVVCIVIPIIPTERALKNNFDQYGFRKTGGAQ